MRTTVTLDPDVTQRLNAAMKRRKVSFKSVLNEALRRGLDRLDQPESPAKPFKVTPIDTELLIDVSCTSQAIALAEGEDYK